MPFPKGIRRIIHHFRLRLGVCENDWRGRGLDEKTQFLLEATAILHDISCPLCREKYGNTDGKHQEAESPRLVQGFLADSGFDAALIDRISYLIAHHHTVTGIDGMDYQILIEADFLVNAAEKGLGKESRDAFSGKRGENGLRQAAVAIYIFGQIKLPLRTKGTKGFSYAIFRWGGRQCPIAHPLCHLQALLFGNNGIASLKSLAKSKVGAMTHVPSSPT